MKLLVGAVTLALLSAAAALHGRQVGEPAPPTYHVDSVTLQYVGVAQIPATVIDASFQGNTARLMCEPVAMHRAQADSGSPMSRAQ